MQGEKRCEIQGGGQEMAVMAKILMLTIQVNLCCFLRDSAPNSPELSLLKVLPFN